MGIAKNPQEEFEKVGFLIVYWGFLGFFYGTLFGVVLTTIAIEVLK